MNDREEWRESVRDIRADGTPRWWWFIGKMSKKGKVLLASSSYVKTLVQYCLIYLWFLLSWLVGFYGISTFVGYLTPNPLLCKKSVLFKTNQFSMNAPFNCQKHFYFKLFSLFKQLNITIQFSVSTVLMSKTVQFQIIQFSISTQLKSKYSLIVKNISISRYSV